MRGGRFLGLLVMLSWAQLQDDFSDGDFTNNPPWSGTDLYWVITSDKRLRANGPSSTATLYLSTPNALIDDTEWRFWVRVAFNPSTQNFARVYLVADRADLTDPNLQGYYLKLGGITGSADSLELWLQNGSTTLVWPAVEGAASADPTTSSASKSCAAPPASGKSFPTPSEMAPGNPNSPLPTSPSPPPPTLACTSSTPPPIAKISTLTTFTLGRLS
jgi:hypothetical protein